MSARFDHVEISVTLGDGDIGYALGLTADTESNHTFKLFRMSRLNKCYEVCEKVPNNIGKPQPFLYLNFKTDNDINVLIDYLEKLKSTTIEDIKELYKERENNSNE